MVFKGRSQGFITLEVQGQELKYTILNLQEFTSARGCMSVVAKAPDGAWETQCAGGNTVCVCWWKQCVCVLVWL